MYPKVTLICDPTEEYERRGAQFTRDTYFPNYNFDCQLELALGGKSSRPGGPKSHASPISAAKTILKSFFSLSDFNCERKSITISPYLGPLGDDHTWCSSGPIAPV
jgi:hypothetical protein